MFFLVFGDAGWFAAGCRRQGPCAPAQAAGCKLAASLLVSRSLQAGGWRLEAAGWLLAAGWRLPLWLQGFFLLLAAGSLRSRAPRLLRSLAPALPHSFAPAATTCFLLLPAPALPRSSLMGPI